MSRKETMTHLSVKVCAAMKALNKPKFHAQTLKLWSAGAEARLSVRHHRIKMTGRFRLVLLLHNNRRADLGAIIQIGDVIVRHPNAA
jgi:hypothetical protein